MPLPTAETVYTVVGAISMILYIFVLLSIIHFRRRNESDFCSSFFTIFISLGIADIFSRIISQLFIILPHDSDLQQFYLSAGNGDNHLLAKFAYFATLYTAYTQYIGHLLISINRFTALTFPFHQNQIWSTKKIVFAIVMQWLIAFLLSVELLVFDSSYSPVYDYDINNLESATVAEVTYLLQSAVSFIVTITCLILNLLAYKNAKATFYKTANDTKSKLQMQMNAHHTRIEYQLFIYGIVLFIAMLPLAIATALTGFAIITSNYTIINVISSQWPWMQEIMSDGNPYILLITSGLLRKRIRKMFINTSVNTTTTKLATIAGGVSNNQNMITVE